MAGYLRSGSTLLERLLSQMNGIITVGEIRYVWRNGFVENHLCGCSVPFRSCPFWNEVVGRAFGGFDRAPATEMLRLQRSLDHLWHMPQMTGRWTTSGFRRRMSRYVEGLEPLYRAIHSVSGADLVIDSSKAPSHGHLVAHLPGVRLRILHLVRDSRAVAHSWTRDVRKPEIHWVERHMPKYTPARSAVEWDIVNIAAGQMRALSVPFTVLRYEDLASEPTAVVGDVLAWLGRPHPDLSFLSGDEATLGVDHTVSGNPSRFETGRVAIRPDLEWLMTMPGHNRMLVTALTRPLLRRYGYQP